MSRVSAFNGDAPMTESIKQEGLVRYDTKHILEEGMTLKIMQKAINRTIVIASHGDNSGCNLDGPGNLILLASTARTGLGRPKLSTAGMKPFPAIGVAMMSMCTVGCHTNAKRVAMTHSLAFVELVKGTNDIHNFLFEMECGCLVRRHFAT